MLEGLVPAMRPGVKVLIIDAIVPPFGSLPNVEERRLRYITAHTLFVDEL